MLGKIELKRGRGQQRMRLLDTITDSMGINLSKLWEKVKDWKAWHAAFHRLVTTQGLNNNNIAQIRMLILYSFQAIQTVHKHTHIHTHTSRSVGPQINVFLISIIPTIVKISEFKSVGMVTCESCYINQLTNKVL